MPHSGAQGQLERHLFLPALSIVSVGSFIIEPHVAQEYISPQGQLTSVPHRLSLHRYSFPVHPVSDLHPATTGVLSACLWAQGSSLLKAKRIPCASRVFCCIRDDFSRLSHPSAFLQHFPNKPLTVLPADLRRCYPSGGGQ